MVNNKFIDEDLVTEPPTKEIKVLIGNKWLVIDAEDAVIVAEVIGDLLEALEEQLDEQSEI